MALVWQRSAIVLVSCILPLGFGCGSPARPASNWAEVYLLSYRETLNGVERHLTVALAPGRLAARTGPQDATPGPVAEAARAVVAPWARYFMILRPDGSGEVSRICTTCGIRVCPQHLGMDFPRDVHVGTWAVSGGVFAFRFDWQDEHNVGTLTFLHTTWDGDEVYVRPQLLLGEATGDRLIVRLSGVMRLSDEDAPVLRPNSVSGRTAVDVPLDLVFRRWTMERAREHWGGWVSRPSTEAPSRGSER